MSERFLVRGPGPDRRSSPMADLMTWDPPRQAGGRKEAGMTSERHRRLRWESVARAVTLLAGLMSQLAKLIDALHHIL